MDNKSTNRAKADLVYSVFEQIAHSYDGANERISLGMQKGWKKMLTERIIHQAPPEEKLLDICCGTGDIALTIAGAREDLEVVGVDFSPAMLREADRKKEELGIRNISFKEGDAMKLPFEDNSFAAATISFGLRNTSDYHLVIQEMSRVVRPGGCIYCLDSFVPESRLVIPFYKIYFNIIMPLIGGGWKHRKEYQWLSHSTDVFLKPNELMELFQTIGLANVRKKSKMFGACVMVWGRNKVRR